ncbi:CsgG/HfaB family protein [Sphingomonas sp. GB1N7]|uniref:CsgG/HfaB family protein n=1 Tax=Parasphingomonas caseinilytica TaxID=3096158 RepID=UPI002FCAB43B
MSRLIRALSLLSFLLIASEANAQSRQPIVAVARIDDLAQSNKSAALTAMILSAVAGTSKFRVVEREQLGNLVGEQGLARKGVVTSRNRGKVGGFEGVDYLIYGSITNFSANKKSDIGSTFLLGALSGSKSTTTTACYKGSVTLSLDIKITDGQSGQIRYVKRLDEVQSAGTICGEGVPEANASALLRSAADKVAIGLVTTVYPIKVADVQQDGTITLNYGEGAVKVGDTLAVFDSGKVVLDPDTGQPMGTSEIRLGLIQITDVQTRMSKAKAVAGFTAPPQVKAIARPATQDDISAFKGMKKKKN